MPIKGPKTGEAANADDQMPKAWARSRPFLKSDSNHNTIVTFKKGRERAQALGIWSSAFAAAAVFGPLIGGPLIDNFGWRSVFLVNLPVGLIGLIMAITFVRESVSQEKTHHFDWWGAITLGIALSALVLVLDKGMDWGWLSFASILTYLITIAFTLVFIYIESESPEPIVNLKFFKNSVFTNTLINNFVVFMGMMGSIFLLPIFAQTFLGYNATQTGYLFMPMAFIMVIASPIGGSLTGRVQPRYVIFVSTLIASFGLYLFHFIDPRSSAMDLIIPLSVMAFGMGLGMAQRTNVIASSVDEHEIGVASSVLALARNISGAFGIALFGTILNNTISSKILSISQISRLNIFNPEYYQQFVGLIILKAQVASYGFVFLVSAIVVFLGSFLALTIIVKEERTDVKVMIE